MSVENAGPVRTIRLEFQADGRKKPVRDNLSAVAASADQLWFGTDEGTLLDCLIAVGRDRFAGQTAFDLKDWLSLPNTTGKKDEIDIEGLCVAGDQLWLPEGARLDGAARLRKPPSPGWLARDDPRQA